MTDHIHKEAWAARQADRRMQDGLVETAGVPFARDAEDYTAEEETAEILADPDTLAAIEEGQLDLDSGDTTDLPPLEEGETELLTDSVLSPLADDEVVEILSGTVETVNRFIEGWPQFSDQILAAERASEHPRKGIVGSE